MVQQMDWLGRAQRALDATPPRWQEYIHCLRIGAAGGDLEAMYSLGGWLLEGKTDNDVILWENDPIEAVDWLERAAAGGHAMAMHSLAACYDEGTGVAADKQRAIALYRQAVRAGLEESAVNLAICYREVGNERGYRRWIERAARAGNAEAILQFAEWRLTHRTSVKQKQRALWDLRALVKRIRADPEGIHFFPDELPWAEALLAQGSRAHRPT